MKKIVVFTHNDLDMAGCVLNIEFKFPDVHKQYFFTNYSDIPKKTKEILKYVSENDVSHLIIADVSFSDNKDSLRELYQVIPIAHVDHHMYPTGFWDEFPKMKVVWDTSKSASLLLNESLGNKGKNEQLDKLTGLIDVYDTWKETHPAFDISQDLNDYFWKVGQEGFLRGVIQRDLKLPEDFFDVVKELHVEMAKAIGSLESSGKIRRSGEASVIFTDYDTGKWFNRVMLREMRSGQEFVIGASDFGIIKVRINRAGGYTEDSLRAIREELTGKPDYGHLYAFTYKVHEDTDTVLKEVQKVMGTIVKHAKKEG